MVCDPPSAEGVGRFPSPAQYEVLYISRLDEDAPLGQRWDEGFFPHVLLLRELSDGRLWIWPRYYIKPDFEDPQGYTRSERFDSRCVVSLLGRPRRSGPKMNRR